MAPPVPALLLFDIDGTLLLRASVEHALALHEAIRAVYGVREPETARVQAAGRTDLDIARQILLQHDVDARTIDAGLEDLRAAAVEAYATLCPDDLSSHVAPGMAELVEELAGRDDVRLSLVTGNLEPIARIKLRAAGIGGWFPSGQGGFGSDDEDRAALPPIARERATRGGHPRTAMCVIGDTPRDIACARADGIGVLAIATGSYGAGELVAADGVASSVAELRALLGERVLS